MALASVVMDRWSPAQVGGQMERDGTGRRLSQVLRKSQEHCVSYFPPLNGLLGGCERGNTHLTSIRIKTRDGITPRC